MVTIIRFLNPKPANYILAVKRVGNTNTVKPAAETKIRKSTSELDAMHDYDQYLTAGAEKTRTLTSVFTNTLTHTHAHHKTALSQSLWQEETRRVLLHIKTPNEYKQKRQAPKKPVNDR